MKRFAVLLENYYEDLEIWYPLLRMREAGFESFTVAPEQGKLYRSRFGYPCTADFAVDQVNAESLDGILLPGGWSTDLLIKDKRVVDLVRNMVESGKVVAAIRRGSLLLCSAKCIQNRHLTTLNAIKGDVENEGGICEGVDRPVVVDGNLVTSHALRDLPDFCKAILERLLA